jgi:hypothetical protein
MTSQFIADLPKFDESKNFPEMAAKIRAYFDFK